MTKDTILGFIRHVLTFGGGFFASSGYVADDEVTAGVSAIVTLVGIIWSALDKKNRSKEKGESVL